MPKLNPQQYVKRHTENVKANERKLKVANEIMEKKKDIIPRRGGRKTKKELQIEERMRDQASFLLFLEKEKDKEPTN